MKCLPSILQKDFKGLPQDARLEKYDLKFMINNDPDLKIMPATKPEFSNKEYRLQFSAIILSNKNNLSFFHQITKMVRVS